MILRTVPSGFSYLFEELGWARVKDDHAGLCTLEWLGSSAPRMPEKCESVAMTEEIPAIVAVITGDLRDDRFITLGPGDGTFQRWRLTDTLLRKLRLEINERLDKIVP